MSTTPQTISIPERNDRSYQITIYDRKEPMNLAGAVIQFMVKDTDEQGLTSAPDNQALITKSSANPAQIQVLDAAAGKVLVYLTPTDTAGLARPWKPYKYDLRVKTAAGKNHTTDAADFIVQDSVSHDVI